MNLPCKYLDRILQIPLYPASTGGSFSGNINKGYARVREKHKIKEFLKHSLTIENPVLLDIGACYGTYSFITLFNDDLTVQAYEPYPLMLQYMKEIIEINEIPNITVNEFGLSDKERHCDMKFGSTFDRANLNLNVGTTHIKPNKNGNFLFKTLDSLNLQKVDMIKMYVEGHEMEVLDGAKETIKRCKPSYIQIEIHDNKEEKLKTIMNEILNNDYYMFQLKDKFDQDFIFKLI